MDVINKQCHIYRMDHTLYKSIPIPTPEGYYLSDVQFVSEKLFNEDALVELVYSYTKYVPTETSYYYTYETRLINENGQVLLNFPGAGYTNVLETRGAGKKFLVYEYNYSVIPYRTYTHVYGLPETEINAINGPAQLFSQPLPYPNPAQRLVNIPVAMPAGANSGILELYDLRGNHLLSYPVTGMDVNVVLPTRELAPGTYLYFVETGASRSESRKITISD
jgi:hypothetical protein